MEIYRISRAVYASKLTASGNSNRWNKRDQFVLYASSSRSLATLEMIVHRSSVVPGDTYKVMVISIPDNDQLIRQVFTHELPENWRSMFAFPVLQQIGSNWYKNKDSLVLKVPSVVIPLEYNYILNLEHPDFKKSVKLVRKEDFFWDDRLF